MEASWPGCPEELTNQRDNLLLSGTCILKPIMGHMGKSQLFDNVDGLEKIAQPT